MQLHIVQLSMSRRAHESADESAYLGPLEETVALGRTPAESMLWQYDTRWGRSVEPLFEEQVY